SSPICRHSWISSRSTAAFRSSDFRADRVVVRSRSTFTACLISSPGAGVGERDVRVVRHGADTKALADFKDLVDDRVGDEVWIGRRHFLEVRGDVVGGGRAVAVDQPPPTQTDEYPGVTPRGGRVIPVSEFAGSACQKHDQWHNEFGSD